MAIQNPPRKSVVYFVGWIDITSSSVSPSFSIPMLAVRLLNFTRSARHVSKPIWYVNSLQKIPVALKSLKTFFHCSSSGYSWRTLPVFRWWFLPQWGLALNLSYSLSSMVLWYSSMPYAPGRKGTYHQRCLHYFSSCGINHFRILCIGLDRDCTWGYWGKSFQMQMKFISLRLNCNTRLRKRK